jgi:DNA-binding CsgD family transcriptional regulator
MDAAAAKYMPVFERHMDQHPVLKHYRLSHRRGEQQNVQKIADFLSNPAWRRTALYSESLRHLDTDFQMIVPIEMDRETAVGIAVNRKTIDFSEHDRNILQELAPHIARAYRNAMRRLRLRRLFNPDCQEQSFETLRHLGLTERESQVLFWLIQGKTTPQIAVIVSCAPRTVDKHLEHLFAKLNVETRSGAIAAVLERIELAP